MTKNETKLLSLRGIAKASAFCLLFSAFSVNAVFRFLCKRRPGCPYLNGYGR